MQTEDSDRNFHLIAIGVDGVLAEPLLDLAPAIVEACQAMADLYDNTASSQCIDQNFAATRISACGVDD